MKYADNRDIATLESGLMDYLNTEDLRKLAGLTGEKAPARKVDIAAVIVRHLEGERLRAVWEGLDELQRAAVAEVVHAYSAQFDVRRFRAKYGKDPEWGSGGEELRRHEKPSALRFFFIGNAMPADLKARLQEFVPAPRAETVSGVDQLPAAYDRPFERWNERQRTRERGTEPVPLIVRETERTAGREMFSVLRLIDAGKLAVSDKTRKASASGLEAIGSLLEGGDYYTHVPARDKWHDENAGPIRAFAWPLLMQAGGLAQLAGTRLQLSKAGRKALSEPAAATLRTLWEKWLGTSLFDELARIECVKGQNGKGRRGLTAASSRRDTIAISLAACPPGQWFSTDEFFRHIQAGGDDFEVTRDPWSLYICEQQYGSLGYEGSAHALETRYVMVFLLEYAATLGLIDVALIPPAGARADFRTLWGTDELPFFSRYDGLMFFRITPLGAWCLGIETECRSIAPETGPALRVLPNLEIAGTGSELEVSDRLALNAWATPVSDFVWKLEIGKLLEAVEAGRSVEELREFLAARSAGALPDTVARLLDDAAARSTQFRDKGLARFIECADAALAALIANDARTGKHCLRAGERHLVVPSASEAAFRRALRNVGYLLAAPATRKRATEA